MSPQGRTIILVDDGPATGSTMLAAVCCARSLKPSKIVVAVPVGSREACSRIRKEVDLLVCLTTPDLFFAVGEWYRAFRQVSDEEVQHRLAENRRQWEIHHKAPTAA